MAVKAQTWKLALTRTPDANRSTSINFVHVNGRSLYIVDRWMVVMEEVNVLRHVKGRGNCPEGKSPDPGNPLSATLCDGVDVYADMKRLR